MAVDLFGFEVQLGRRRRQNIISFATRLEFSGMVMNSWFSSLTKVFLGKKSKLPNGVLLENKN
jgi:hypothetical protein